MSCDATIDVVKRKFHSHSPGSQWAVVVWWLTAPGPSFSFHFQRCGLIIQAESVSSEHKASFWEQTAQRRATLWNCLWAARMKHTQQTHIGPLWWWSRTMWLRESKLWCAERCCWRGCFPLLNVWVKRTVSWDSRLLSPRCAGDFSKKLYSLWRLFKNCLIPKFWVIDLKWFPDWENQFLLLVPELIQWQLQCSSVETLRL